MKAKSEFKTTDEKHEYYRMYFAGLAMQGLLSLYDQNEQSPIVPNENNVKYMAQLSVKAADELLKQLES